VVHYSRFFTFRRGVLDPNSREKGGLSVLREAYILRSSGVTAFPITSTAVIAPANHVEKVRFAILYLEARIVEEVCNSKSCNVTCWADAVS